jgi:hypothetical protein
MMPELLVFSRLNVTVPLPLLFENAEVVESVVCAKAEGMELLINKARAIRTLRVRLLDKL